MYVHFCVHVFANDDDCLMYLCCCNLNFYVISCIWIFVWNYYYTNKFYQESVYVKKYVSFSLSKYVNFTLWKNIYNTYAAHKTVLLVIFKHFFLFKMKLQLKTYKLLFHVVFVNNKTQLCCCFSRKTFSPKLFFKLSYTNNIHTY